MTVERTRGHAVEHIVIGDRADAFAVVAGTSRSQAAVMTLQPREATGRPLSSEHPEADQWLYVLSGTGEAQGSGWRQRLVPGSLLLIPAGEGHRIRADEHEELRTLNLYAPAHY
jgi:quercetin dioxygenase-like cupin family protein